MASPALHPGAAVAGVGGQQVLQHAGAEPGHGAADGQLGCLQGRPASGQRPCRRAGQALYLRGGLRRERRPEPPLSPAGPAGDRSADWPGGLASQIASLTSTICSLTRQELPVVRHLPADLRQSRTPSSRLRVRPPADRVHRYRGPCPGWPSWAQAQFGFPQRR